MTVGSPFALIDADGGLFYRERARSLRGLRGAAVVRQGAELGRLEDLVLLPDGSVVELVVDGPLTHGRVQVDDRLAVAGVRIFFG